MTWWVACRNGSRIAGSRIIRARRATAPRANCRTAGNTCCAEAHGETTRAICAARAAITTTKMFATFRMDSAWHVQRREIDMTELTRRAVVAAAILAPAGAFAQTAAPQDAYLYIIWPQDGARIKGGFWCRFGLRNMGIARAGDKTPNAGHHHLFVDLDEPIKAGDVIP